MYYVPGTIIYNTHIAKDIYYQILSYLLIENMKILSIRSHSYFSPLVMSSYFKKF